MSLCLSVCLCQSVVQLMSAAIQPLIDAIGRAMDAILLTMHDEDFSQ